MTALGSVSEGRLRISLCEGIEDRGEVPGLSSQQEVGD
jgi:hypothetical protein